jgi:hypothetical protein
MVQHTTSKNWNSVLQFSQLQIINVIIISIIQSAQFWYKIAVPFQIVDDSAYCGHHQVHGTSTIALHSI